MSWILIVIWYSSNYGHQGVTMQEFNNQQACQYAANIISTKRTARMELVCLPKGETK